MKTAFLATLALALCGTLSAARAAPEDDLRRGDANYRKRNAAALQKQIAQLQPADRSADSADSDSAQPVALPMLQYWNARLLLRRGKTETAAEFVRAETSPFLAAELRRDLLRHLAQAREWKAFAEFAPAGGTCARMLQSQNTFGEASPAPRPADLRRLWSADDKFNDPLCNRAYQQARRDGAITRDDVWRKLRRVAGRKQYGATRNLLRMFPVARYSTVRKVMRAPVRHIRAKHGLRERLNRELVMISAMAAARARPSVAISRWRAFSKYFSQSENADVYAALGEWAARWGRDDAMQLFRKAPLEVYDESARAWRVRAALRAGDFNDVAKTIAAMPEEERVVTAWRYWNAFALRQNGNAQGAKKIWRDLAAADDFYGLLAREELGLPLVNPEAHPDPPAGGKVPPDARLALALRKIGKADFARKMWRRAVAAASPSDRLAAAKLAAAAEWHLASIRAADGVKGEAAHRLRFPRPYSEVIDKLANARGLDRAFVYGLIRQESRFMPKIVSSAGARGLMQVMPATAKRVARRHGYSRYRLSRLTRVDTNVVIGARYLADLAASLKNHPVLMAAAYNAGPGRAKRWTKRSAAWLTYIETIPITETRLYVKHVLANRAHYDRALGRDGGKMREVILRPANRSAQKVAVIFINGLNGLIVNHCHRGIFWRDEVATKNIRDLPRQRGSRACARPFRNRLSAEIADIAVGDSAMTVIERTPERPKHARILKIQQPPQLLKELRPLPRVAPHSVVAAAEVEPSAFRGDPNFARRRLAVHDDRPARVGADVQHAAAGVKVNPGLVQNRLNFGEQGVAQVVVFAFVHNGAIIQQ